MKSILLAKDTTSSLSCKIEKMRSILTLLTVVILLASSFTLSSCKKRSKDQPGRDGNTNNKPSASNIIDDSKTPTQIPNPDIPADLSAGRDGNTDNKPSDTTTSSNTIDDSKAPTQILSPDIPIDPGRDGNTDNKSSDATTSSSTIDDSKTPTQIPSPDIPIDISTLKKQIQCQLGKMAAQLVVARNAAKAAQAADSAVTGKSNEWPVSIAKEPEVENAKGLVEMAENANTEAQKFAVTAYQKEVAQADPEAMVLVKAVELVSAQITAQAASARDCLAHILHMQAFNVAKVVWYTFDDDCERDWLKSQLQVKHWYEDASAENWNKIYNNVWKDGLEPTENKKKKINDMKISSQAQLKTNKTYRLAAQESEKASDVAEKLEGEAGQAVLDMVKAAVTQAKAE
jgi:hypothetical protein